MYDENFDHFADEDFDAYFDNQQKREARTMNTARRIDIDTDRPTIPNAHRPLCAIAAEIRQAWPKPYFGAVPYLQAMAELGSIDDRYGYDPAAHIVRYFLSNATTWRGDTARRIKAELKALLCA